jgi:hypothetical protein
MGLSTDGGGEWSQPAPLPRAESLLPGASFELRFLMQSSYVDALFDLSRAASKAFTIWARLRGDHLLIIDRPSGDSNPLDENT